MTTNELKNLSFKAGMKVKHITTNRVFEIASVDFQECLIGIFEEEFYDQQLFDKDEESIKWLRCENCVLMIED